MIRLSALLTVVLFLTTPAVAQDWAKERLENSPRHLEYVTVEHDGRQVECFVAYPEVSNKATAVIVIHEIFGLTDWVRGVADQLAEAGYIAIAPDLLSGMGDAGGGTASFGGGDAVRKAITSLPQEQITADLDATAAYVTQLPAANGKLAVCGFCWGGRQTFAYATENPELLAALVFYGNGPEELAAIEKIQAPVYGFYGENDARINATIPQSTELMKEAGKSYEPVTYDGAGHGFMRAGEDPAGMEANQQARAAAWQRVKKILGGL